MEKLEIKITNLRFASLFVNMYFISPGTYLANMSKIAKFPFNKNWVIKT